MAMWLYKICLYPLQVKRFPRADYASSRVQQMTELEVSVDTKLHHPAQELLQSHEEGMKRTRVSKIIRCEAQDLNLATVWQMQKMDVRQKGKRNSQYDADDEQEEKLPSKINKL